MTNAHKLSVEKANGQQRR